MAKHAAGKSQQTSDTATEPTKNEPTVIVNAVVDTAEARPAPAVETKKESTTTRPKKQPVPTGKNGSLLPSAYKLDHLKAAVAAAGNAEKLLLILHHVEEAGGKSEVVESIEAYRVLKTVLEE